jgi:hypothetical protein
MTEAITNRIGLRRLFDAKGCSLSGRDDLAVNWTISELYAARIYLGPKPEHGIQVVSGSPKYIVPGEGMSAVTFEYQADASKSSYPGRFFLEISVSCSAEPVSYSSGSEEARAELLQQAEARRSEFQNVIDLVAGLVGLRFHRQFVLEELDENAFALEGEYPLRNFFGPSWELLESLSLNENGIAQLEGYAVVVADLSEKIRKKLGLIFHWLLRAWRERDHVYKFVALFLPLEAVLGTVNIPPNDEQNKQASSIRQIILEQGGDNQRVLLDLFDKAFQRLSPTLDERFVYLAQSAQLPGWEGDVEAFRKFKRLRNALVHRGDKDVQHQLSVGEEEIRTLTDLVERYVNFVIFRDAQVYESRWRPQVK